MQCFTDGAAPCERGQDLLDDVAGKSLFQRDFRAEDLRQLVARADDSAAARRDRVSEHLTHAGDHIDVDVLLSDHAWR